MRNSPPVYEPPATTSIDLSTDSTLQRDSADTDVASPSDLEKTRVEQQAEGVQELNRKSAMSASGTMMSTMTDPETAMPEKGEVAAQQRNESEMLTGTRLWTLFGYAERSLVGRATES